MNGASTPDDILEGFCSDSSYYTVMTKDIAAPRDVQNPPQGCCAAPLSQVNTAQIFAALTAPISDTTATPIVTTIPSGNDGMIECKGGLGADVALARFCVAVKVACSYAMLCYVSIVILVMQNRCRMKISNGKPSPTEGEQTMHKRFDLWK